MSKTHRNAPVSCVGRQEAWAGETVGAALAAAPAQMRRSAIGSLVPESGCDYSL